MNRPTLSASYTDEGVTISYNGKTTEIFPSLDLVDNEKVAQTLGVDSNKIWMFKIKTIGRELKPKGLPKGPDAYFDKGMFVPKRLADEIMEHYHFLTLRDTKEIFVYMDGI